MKALIWLAAGAGAIELNAGLARADVPFTGESFVAPACVIVQVYYDADGNPIDPFEHPEVRTDDVRATALESALARYEQLFGSLPPIPDIEGDPLVPRHGASSSVSALAVPTPGAALVLGAGALTVMRRRRRF